MEINLQKRSTKEDNSSQAKEFLCEYCPSILKSRKAWKDHHRIHTGEKPHLCSFDDCGKAFIQYSSFQKHMRTHQGDRPYECQVCGQKFTQACNLKRHKRKHTGEKPFACNICPKSFTTSSNLKQHIETHDRKMLTCPVCNKAYSNTRSFSKHKKSHKNVDDNQSYHNEEEEDIDENMQVDEFDNINTTEPIKREIIFDYHEDQSKKLKTDLILASKIDSIEEPNSSLFYNVQSELEEVHSHKVNNGSQENDEMIRGELPLGLDQSESIEIIDFSKCLMLIHGDHTDYLYKGKLYQLMETGEYREHELEATEHNPSICKPLKEMSHVENYLSLAAKYNNLIAEQNGNLTHDILNNSCNVFLCGGCSQPKPVEPESKKCCSQKDSESKASNGCCSEKTQPKESNSKSCSSNKEAKQCCSSKLSAPEEKSVQGAGSCCSSKKPTEKSSNVSEQPQMQGSSCSCSSDCGCKGSNTLLEKRKNSSECADTDRSKQFKRCLCSETRSLKHIHGEACSHLTIYHNGHIDYLVGNQLHHTHGDHCDDHGLIYIVKEKEL